MLWGSLIVSNSLALAFSLAGIVAAVRFRTTLADARDIVFIFLAIAVGFAAGVQVVTIGLVLSMIFNFVLVLIWRYDFGRAVLEPTAASQWEAPLQDLAGKDGGGNKIRRDLVLALTPVKRRRSPSVSAEFRTSWVNGRSRVSTRLSR
jgi:hypothetical protein